MLRTIPPSSDNTRTLISLVRSYLLGNAASTISQSYSLNPPLSSLHQSVSAYNILIAYNQAANRLSPLVLVRLAASLISHLHSPAHYWEYPSLALHLLSSLNALSEFVRLKSIDSLLRTTAFALSIPPAPLPSSILTGLWSPCGVVHYDINLFPHFHHAHAFGRYWRYPPSI